MVAQIVIKDVGPMVDGSYDLPTQDTLTHGELRIIKREADVRAGEIDEAFEKGDSDLLVAFALIALRRAGKEVPSEVLWDSELGAIDFETDEDDALPPDLGSGESGSESDASS